MILTGSTFWQCLPKQKGWEIAKEYPKPRSSSGCLHSDAKHEGVIVKCPLSFGPYSHSLCLECLNFIWDCEERSFVSAALFLCWRNLLYEVTSACMTYPHTLRHWLNPWPSWTTKKLFFRATSWWTYVVLGRMSTQCTLICSKESTLLHAAVLCMWLACRKENMWVSGSLRNF